MSEGQHVEMTPHIPYKSDSTQTDNSSDTFDTIEWLLKNVSCNNGRVGLWGISYPGFYVSAGIIDAHPAIMCASPQAPIADWFAGDDMHHNGAFSLLPAFNFFEISGQPHDSLTTEYPERFAFEATDAYNFFLNIGRLDSVNSRYFQGKVAFWDSVVHHPNYDYYWQQRNIRQYLANVQLPVMVVGGWFDQENLYGALETYRSIRSGTKQPVTLVVGPWTHGWWATSDGSILGIMNFEHNPNKYYQEQIEKPFFDHYLKDEPFDSLPAAIVFETGSNQWKEYQQWPPENFLNDTLFLYDGKAAKIKSATDGFDYDTYLSDPNNPVPYTPTFHQPSLFYDKPFINSDQRFADARPDVLTYATTPLKDTLRIAGPIWAKLFASISGTDADFVVKIIDVYPSSIYRESWPNKAETAISGYQQLVRGEIMRGKYRNSLEHPEPFVPGKVTEIELQLNDVNHAFLPGHCLMVQIQSSWFPLFDRNPQRFMNIYEAEPKDFRPAEINIYTSKDYPSRIEFKSRETNF